MLQQAEPAKPTEQTLAIIKPDAVAREDEIIVHIQKAGFTISNVSSFQSRGLGVLWRTLLCFFFACGSLHLTAS